MMKSVSEDVSILEERLKENSVIEKVYLKELVALRKQLTIANKTEDAITVAIMASICDSLDRRQTGHEPNVAFQIAHR